MNDLVSMWKEPKYKNIIKLMFWAIFIVFVSSLCVISNKRQIKNNNYEGSMLNLNNEILNLANRRLNVYYKLDDYVVEGIFDEMMFKGKITYIDGTSYNVKYENGSLVKDNDNGEFVIISVDAKYMNPLYLIELFIQNQDIMKKENNSYYYNIDNVKYYLSISNDDSYSVKMIKDNKESIFEYKVV